MQIACLDLEGVLVPEIWINVARKTGIDALLATTRDVPDYDVLMTRRLRILDEHGLKIGDIEEVIESLGPLEGAAEFLDWLRSEFQVVILSDTFYEFAKPLMRQLGWPALFCHRLGIAPDGRVEAYHHISMLAEADRGILFRPPQNVVDEFPQFPVATDYAGLREAFLEARADLE